MILYIILFLFLVLIYRISRSDSLSAKISYLMGIKISRFEKARFKYYPINKGQEEKETERSSILIVAFAGGALRIGGEVQYEMQNTFRTFDCDQLYVLDPTGMAWYLQDPNNSWKGFEYYENELKKYCQHYKYVIFTGSCLGATATLFFSHLCNHVICFNPQINPSEDPRWSYRIGARCLPSHLRKNFLSLMKQSIEKTQGSIEIHVSNEREEIRQSDYLQNYYTNKLQIILHSDYQPHNLAKYLRSKNELLPLYQKVIDKWRRI